MIRLRALKKFRNNTTVLMFVGDNLRDLSEEFKVQSAFRKLDGNGTPECNQ